ATGHHLGLVLAVAKAEFHVRSHQFGQQGPVPSIQGTAVSGLGLGQLVKGGDLGLLGHVTVNSRRSRRRTRMLGSHNPTSPVSMAASIHEVRSSSIPRTICV